MKEWQAIDDLDDLWHNFENILFSEQQARDHVSQYHVYPTWDHDDN